MQLKVDNESSELSVYEALTKQELINLLLEKRPEGINLVFAGKANAKLLAKKVGPRALRAVPDCSAGAEELKSKNLVIEGDNLKGMVSLYKFHGQVDLIIADPPYNTGKDFRYSDKWAADPNNTDNGEFVSFEDGSRLTKWMTYMLPRLQMMKAMLRPGPIYPYIRYRKTLIEIDDAASGDSVEYQKAPIKIIHTDTGVMAIVNYNALRSMVVNNPDRSVVVGLNPVTGQSIYIPGSLKLSPNEAYEQSQAPWWMDPSIQPDPRQSASIATT